MLSDVQMLNYIRQGVQMGCYGIDRVLPKAKNPQLKSALTSQRQEYRAIYRDADRLLKQCGGKSKNISPVSKASTGIMSAMQLMADSSTTKIAEMMITGNTMGVTKSLRHIHDYSGNPKVEDVAQKLLQTEDRNIRQMQKYL